MHQYAESAKVTYSFTKQDYPYAEPAQKHSQNMCPL